MRSRKDERCETCDWWEGDEEFGDCRRNPPFLTRGKTALYKYRGIWPETYKRNWCGEWK